ncbi:ERAD-associated E3 ubiquitin-protein ligase component HRD3A-like [Gossypium australe]|uniref:ERAD-associated E3 ubiquitin-protein ligase component HRD3A-like n=1 Tax=Gossypium australe TaxID=47621 RepID=A0A5B6W477_9ROSI|nr:ERAD-associated E3 ubiquitin-protein ligase component HRD3A-like [Gossypium australe]
MYRFSITSCPHPVLCSGYTNATTSPHSIDHMDFLTVKLELSLASSDPVKATWQCVDIDNENLVSLVLDSHLETLIGISSKYMNLETVHIIDSLPEVYPRVEEWVENVIMEEGNATILTLFVCLLTVLYLRERQRRHAIAAAGAHEPNEHVVPAAR